MCMNIINEVRNQLNKAQFRSPQLFYISCWLANKITGMTTSQLLTTDEVLSNEQREQLEQCVYELTVLKKPIQYVLGTVEFCGLSLKVQPPILIPRPETEEWVQAMIKRLVRDKTSATILDIGTGSGCVALALASALPAARVLGVDCSAQALVLAQENKRLLNIINVDFAESDLFASVKGKFDVIISNPPYVAECEWQQLEDPVRIWEDKKALVADDRGLALLKCIIEQSPLYLAQDGELVLEIGHAQGDAVCTFMRSCGYTDVEIYKDFAGCDRLVIGWR